MIGVLGGWAMASQATPSEIYKVGLNTTRLLMMMGDLIIGWLLLRQAEVAQAALAAGALRPRTCAFYTGKVAAAKWFAANRLPLLAAERVVAETTTSVPWSCPKRRSDPQHRPGPVPRVGAGPCCVHALPESIAKAGSRHQDRLITTSERPGTK